MVEKMKKALERFYIDRCTVYESAPVADSVITKFEDVVKYENVPCRLSAKAYLFGESAAGEGNNLAKITKKAKLFLPPEYVVLPGSRIEITSQGQTNMYAKSGAMNFYPSHNEMMLELEKKYA